MPGFIERTARAILERHENLSSLALVLPNRRSAIALKSALQARLSGASAWLPKTYTMHELMRQISGLSLIEKFPLWLDFYAVARQQSEARPETFDEFIKWASQALADFDELDLNLVDLERFFSYIGSVERISHWEPRDLAEESPFVKKHLLFWERLAPCYYQLRERLLQKGQAYHGLIFRSALDRLDNFLLENPDLEKILFIGMNALNQSEAALIQKLIEQGKAETYWDVDAYYYEDETQEAGTFVRSYFKRWPVLKDKPIRWVAEDFKKYKQIEAIGTPGQVGQAKLVGSLLKGLIRQGEDLSRAVVVSVDERLLIPLLHAFPKEIDRLDVSVRYPLQALPLGHGFLIIFRLFANRQKLGRDQFYHKDLLQLLAEVHFKKLMNEESGQFSTLIVQKNLSFIPDTLIRKNVRNEILLSILDAHNKDPKTCLNALAGLSQNLRTVFLEDDEDHSAALEFLSHFDHWIRDVRRLLREQSLGIVEIKSLALLYEQWLRFEKSRFFRGNPGGALLMGLLETRLLDFDTVIMTSVNEGVLPPEKTQGSWIPFDVRKRFGLPTYQEQDALYAYHFYHLLQRARKVYLIYNTEPDEYGSGEKSRFIHQLEIESPHEIRHKIASPASANIERMPILVKKDASVMRRLEEIASKGFSPSSISLYIRDPLMFYQQKVLGLREHETVKESVEAHTLGTIAHRTLEALYRPEVGRPLTLEALQEMKRLYEPTVERLFQEAGADHRRGKNLLICRVVKKYVENLIAWDEAAVQQKCRIVIQSLERALLAPVEASSRQARLYGLIDRVDICDGLLRIIDYKTGAVKPNKLRIASADAEALVQEPEYSKALQLLIYAYLWLDSSKGTEAVYPSIASLRQMRGGLMPLSVDEDQRVTAEAIERFLPQLSAKLAELLNPEEPFVENLEKVPAIAF